MTVDISPFHAMFIGRLAHKLKAEGRSIIHMEFGQPSTGAPAAAIAEAHRVLDREPGNYWESPALMARIARHYHDKHGVEMAPAQVVLTCGASPALVLALTLSFAPGDRVALARPGYVSYRNTLRALHMEPVEIACGPETRYQLTADLVEREAGPLAGLIVASPANPTGTIIARDELAAIAEVCRRRKLKIVSDEIYHGLSYGEPAHSMLEFEPRALVVNSFSKYFSMVGWRLGWLAGPADLAERARAYMSNFYLTPPSLSQHAGLIAMDCEAELEGHIDTYRKNRELLLAALPDLGLKSIAPPDGAFYIWAHIGHLTRDSMAFCEGLLRDTGVATAPGVDFDPEVGHEYMRFSFAESTAQIEEAIRRLKPWFAAKAALAS
ncbi:MAG: aminotransferase [Caulobacter sp.]|nr:aminotransferase [Caulobacter sp.]